MSLSAISLSSKNYLYLSQIKSVESQKETKSEIKLLNNLSIPSYIKEFTNGNKIYYRIRLGYFSDSISALKFSDFLGYKQPWIIKEEPENRHFSQFLEVHFDTLPSVPSMPYFYISLNNSFIAFYIKRYGIEASVLPSKMIIYTLNSTMALKIEELTGFTDTDTSILYGKPFLIEKNHSGIFSSKENLGEIQEQFKLSSSDLLSAYSFFADSTELRVNLLSELNLKTNTIRTIGKKGFDYIDSGAKLHLWNNRIERKRLGHYKMQQLSDDGINIISIKNLNILYRLTEDSSSIIIMLYKVKE